MKFTNDKQIPLTLAVPLVFDEYDYIPNTISATALMKPLKQVILSKRVTGIIQDLSDSTNPFLGKSVHAFIEKAWITNYKESLNLLGYSDSFIERVVVNPEGELLPNAIPVYMEKRSSKVVKGVTVTGKFDFVFDGKVSDFKCTSVYTYINGNKDEDYRLQLSIYRWLNPTIITDDIGAIDFIFKDWSAARELNSEGYPESSMIRKDFSLLSTDQVQSYVETKVSSLILLMDADEDKLPRCSDDELWRKPPIWKYYKNPNNRTRSTKNFTDKRDAYTRLHADGNVGVVVEVLGSVTACKYCPAFSICKQKDEYLESGELEI